MFLIEDPALEKRINAVRSEENNLEFADNYEKTNFLTNGLFNLFKFQKQEDISEESDENMEQAIDQLATNIFKQTSH